MDTKVIEKKKNALTIQVAGEDHTLGNAITSSLWKEKGTDSAAYRIDHPLKGNLQLTVKSSKKKPKDLLITAAKTLEKDAKEFKKKFSSSCK